MTQQFNFTVVAPSQVDQVNFTVTVRVEVPDGDQKKCSDVLHYIRTVQIKNDLMNGWMREHAPAYGMEIRGGPRPVFATPGDRGSAVVAYEQDFKLTRTI